MNKPSRNVLRALALFVVSGAVLSGGCRDGGKAANQASLPARDQVGASGPHFYSTTFPKTENPINENGNWLGGSGGGASLWTGHLRTGGRLWGNVQTEAGFAFGVDEPTEFGDPSAILTGSWGPTQTVTAKVRINKTPLGHCCHEVELRMRTTISDQSITGYEAYCSVMPEQAYCHIARWNGPNGSYWNFETVSPSLFLVDGDIIKATATGTNPTVITLYRNGEQILQAADTGAAGGGFGAFGPWISGNPGIGFYDNHDSDWKDFGFSSFSATDAELK
jgi:hypothetical protein